MIQLKNLIGLVPEDSIIIIRENDYTILNNIVNGLAKESEKYLNSEVVSIYPDISGLNIDYQATQIITIKC